MLGGSFPLQRCAGTGSDFFFFFGCADSAAAVAGAAVSLDAVGAAVPGPEAGGVVNIEAIRRWPAGAAVVPGRAGVAGLVTGGVDMSVR